MWLVFRPQSHPPLSLSLHPFLSPSAPLPSPPLPSLPPSLQSSQKHAVTPEVFCIISPLGCFQLYERILDEIEERRKFSRTAVYAFLKALIANPFPAPVSVCGCVGV